MENGLKTFIHVEIVFTLFVLSSSKLLQYLKVCLNIVLQTNVVSSPLSAGELVNAF